MPIIMILEDWRDSFFLFFRSEKPVLFGGIYGLFFCETTLRTLHWIRLSRGMGDCDGRYPVHKSYSWSPVIEGFYWHSLVWCHVLGCNVPETEKSINEKIKRWCWEGGKYTYRSRKPNRSRGPYLAGPTNRSCCDTKFRGLHHLEGKGLQL